jgi:hypothetical protein
MIKGLFHDMFVHSLRIWGLISRGVQRAVKTMPVENFQSSMQREKVKGKEGNVLRPFMPRVESHPVT